jgi:hypothetical protein
MDRKELNSKLQTFKKTCEEAGYISGDFYFDEAYPGIQPTSLIVKMMVKKSWMDTLTSPGKAICRLSDVLFETTDAKTRENVHVLSIYGEDERDLIQKTNIREAA